MLFLEWRLVFGTNFYFAGTGVKFVNIISTRESESEDYDYIVDRSLKVNCIHIILIL